MKGGVRSQASIGAATPGRARIDDHAAAVVRSVLPVGRRILGAENEGDAVVGRAERGDAAAGAAAAFVEQLDFPCFDIHALDARAVEHGAGGVAADVIDDPAAVGRPHAGVGEDVVVRGVG